MRYPGQSRAAVDSRDGPQDRLRRLIGQGSSRLAVMRSEVSELTARWVVEALGPTDRPVCVVLPRSDPVRSFYLRTARERAQWNIVAPEETLSSISVMARSLGSLSSFVLDDDRESRLRWLWLPPSVLEGYACLPFGKGGVLVLHDWDQLVGQYLDGGPQGKPGVPGPEDLDRLLTEALEVLSDICMVVATPRPSVTLLETADLVVNVAAAKPS